MVEGFKTLILTYKTILPQDTTLRPHP